MNPAASRVQLISGELIADLLRQARESPRRRMNYNFHASAGENPNRFLNVILEGSYIAPHRHSNPPKPEAFVVLEGRLAFFIFDDSGGVREAHLLGREPGDAAGIDVPPDTWHTLAVLTPHAVCYEVKPGPYSPAADKDFAPWAPREGDPAAPAYLEALLRRAPPFRAQGPRGGSQATARAAAAQVEPLPRRLAHKIPRRSQTKGY